MRSSARVLALVLYTYASVVANLPEAVCGTRMGTGSPYMTYYLEQFTATNDVRRLTPDAYNSLRSLFFRNEESKALGADIVLNDRELQANQIIMKVKINEYNEGLITPHLFKPSQHLFSVLEQIKSSPLFQYISDMPKGAVLHAHDTALCSTDFLIDLTYRPDLWACLSYDDGDFGAEAFRFAKQKPTLEAYPHLNCTWNLLADVRKVHSASKVDIYFRQRFTLYPTEKYLDNNFAWQHMMKIFGLLDGLLLYVDSWSDYYANALKEFQADGVQYLEFRSTLPILYDMEGNNFTEMDTVRIYKQTLEKFMSSNPQFIGSKLIYAPLRNVDENSVSAYIRTCIQIKDKYPDFVAGFDLVGQEELGRPLKDFIPQLLTLPDGIDFFFHAGETNWHGSSVDENVIDAVLLGTKRIGHGFAVIKHPLVLQLLKEKNIAIEVNPVSNQILQLVADYRNHPCSHLFADNYPVVISSDDPSFWKATPLSHDFYIAFLGIASAHSDLRLLKKLAINSIEYSSLNAEQKKVAMAKWVTQWDLFIERVITGETNAAQKRLSTNLID